MRRSWIPVLLALTIFGCGETGTLPDSERFVTSVADSAGVSVIRVRQRAVPADTVRLDDHTLAFSLGGDPDGPAEVFRVASVALLPNDRLAVADSRSRVRVFAFDGEPPLMIGREGEGPGEFRSVTFVGAYRGDSVAVFDRAQRRASVFDSEGRFGRALSLAELDPNSSKGIPDFVGITALGGMVLRWTSPQSPNPGLVTHPARIEVRGPDGELRYDFGVGPGAQQFLAERPGGGVVIMSPAFGRAPAVSSGPNRVSRSDGDQLVRSFGPTGELLSILRTSGEPIAVSQEIREQFLSKALEGAPNPELARPMLESSIVHTSLPWVGDARVEGTDAIWIRPGAGPVRDEGWIRISHEGHASFLPLNESDEFLQALAGWVVILRTDDFDVEALEVHRMPDLGR